jgi:hypothetical protein
MIVKRTTKSKTSQKPKTTTKKDWRAAICQHFSKVPAVDAVFANALGETIHIYSIVEKFGDESCEQLLKQEDKVEKAFPKLSFEFHTRAHQGRAPDKSGPWGSELVYLR